MQLNKLIYYLYIFQRKKKNLFYILKNIHSNLKDDKPFYWLNNI